ncbi:MAG: hypothetical protein OEU36_05995 [Gammaproteobacteria bacterium]|nr:hypothetical protein [Gammaproteobacteria bacterium]
MAAITVPKLRRDHTVAEVRPRRVAEWLRSLPQADARYSAQQIHQALFAQNRIRLDQENRLSLMELYCEPVAAAVETMRQSYIGMALPLSAKTQKLVGFIQRLLTEMANGYKIVANDMVQDGVSGSTHSDVVMALRRASGLVGELMLTAYEIYTPPPTGTWRQLHEIYQFAESNGFLDSKISDKASSDEGGTTVEQDCLRIFLLGACSPLGLLPGECRRVHELLPRWCDDVEFGEIEDLGHPEGRFLVSLRSDVAPIPLCKVADVKNEPHLRILDTVEAMRMLHKLLRDLEQGNEVSVGNQANGELDSGDTAMVRRVGRLLAGVGTRRHSTRTGEASGVSVCIGLNSIHYFANGERRFESAKMKSIGEDGNEGEGDIEQSDGDVKDLVCLDPSDPNFGDKVTDVPEKGEVFVRWQDAGDYRLHSFDVVNESAGGLGLRSGAATDIQFRVGELVAMQYATLDGWHLGVVRWVQQTLDDNLEFGVQMIAPEFRPIAAKSVSTDADSFVRALLLSPNAALRQPESLVLPRGVYRQDQQLTLTVEGEELVIAPGRLLDRTGSYDQLLLNSSLSGQQ